MANAAQAKLQNTMAVLKQIQQHPGISRPEIGQACLLSPSTVQGITQQLEKCEIIESSGLALSNGGRKAQCYQLNKQRYRVVSVNIRINKLEVGVLNLGLEVLAHTEQAMDISSAGPEAYVAVVANFIRGQIEQSGAAFEDLLAIGVSIPGPANFETGAVQQLIRAPQWEGFPFGPRLAREMGLPVFIDKDAYCGVRYLEYNGQVQSGRSVAYVSVRNGISAALLINGQVFRGGHSLAGEIGHITVRRDGLPCPCGNTGCLELYCSDLGIISQYNALAGTNHKNVNSIIALAGQNDEVAQRVFSQAVTYLVETTTSLIMNYDPDEIWVNCTWLEKQRSLYFKMLDILYAKSIFTRKHNVDVRLLEEQKFYLHAGGALAASAQLFNPGSRLHRAIAETNA